MARRQEAATSSLYGRIPAWADESCVHVIVDTPLGSANKFKWDEALGAFALSRILPKGLVFPCEFASIPGTRGDDGDALDVALLVDAPSFAGCVIKARILGAILATQVEKKRRVRNDRFVAVPVTAVNNPVERDLKDVDPPRISALESFFEAYNRAQGRRFEVQRRIGAAQAIRRVRRATSEGHT